LAKNALRLQRSLGNRAIQELVETDALPVGRLANPVWSFTGTGPRVQRKLARSSATPFQFVERVWARDKGAAGSNFLPLSNSSSRPTCRYPLADLGIRAECDRAVLTW
jgi:hypothetical protein